MTQKFKKYLFYISSIMLLVSAVLYMTEWSFVPYVYAVACAGVAVCYLTSPYRGTNKRLKRLNIQEAIAAILLPVSSFFMFRKQNEWFLFLAVSAVLQLYVVFVKDRKTVRS
ncbi:MAG: hypothetical protein LBU57_05080 [Dysgonamonadaceae bacterium]|jgi:hypothetical protein|nr:hypothetical protein [Dysgonamonadaceae bacterium]